MSSCRVCSAETDAFLCWSCYNRVEQAICELPILMRSVRGVATRQSRAFRPDSEKQPDERADPEADLPAMLRSRDGRITLPQRAMPGDIAATALLATAQNTVTTWVRHILESRGEAIPVGPACATCWHRTCTLIRCATDPWAFLLTYAETIRFDVAAADAFRHITELHAAMETMVDNEPTMQFLGRCDKPDVRIDALPLLGPPCSGLTCPHESCEAIRQATVTLAPVPTVCGTGLYAAEGAEVATCEGCGAEYDAARRRTDMASNADDEWARPHAIAQALTNLDWPVKPETVRKWIERDAKQARSGRQVDRALILQVGIDDEGKPLYRVGDVRKRIEQIRSERVA